MATLIATGTGRSGTGYMSQLLDIGHEHTFTVEGIRHPMTHDSSVFASRYIDLHLGDAYKLHVVREPTACITSLARGPVFGLAEPVMANRYREWCRSQWPEVYGQPHPLLRAAWWWYVVNRHVEQYADETVQVETIVPEMVQRWTGLMGRPSHGAIERLLSLPSNVNSRPGANEVITWVELPPEVQQLAERYGYTP